MVIIISIIVIISSIIIILIIVFIESKLKKNSEDKERGWNPLSIQLQRLSKNYHLSEWRAFSYVTASKLRYFGLLLFMFAWLPFGVETRK